MLPRPTSQQDDGYLYTHTHELSVISIMCLANAVRIYSFSNSHPIIFSIVRLNVPTLPSRSPSKNQNTSRVRRHDTLFFRASIFIEVVI